MKTKLPYALIVIGALLTFVGFLAVLAGAYFLGGSIAALFALLGLVGIGAAGLIVAGDPAEVEVDDAYAAQEGARQPQWDAIRAALAEREGARD